MSVYHTHTHTPRPRRRSYPETRPLRSGLQFSPLRPDPKEQEIEEAIEGEVIEVLAPPETPKPPTTEEVKALMVIPQPPKPRRQWRWKINNRLAFKLAGVLMALSFALSLSALLIPWLFFPTFVVTISPTSKQASATFTTPGNLLAAKSETGSKTVTTTGTESQLATQASGTITLLNTGEQAVTVPAHFILTGQDGVQVSTDNAVTVPVSSPAGQAEVRAHARNTGPQGNIPAFDVTGFTSIQNIEAKNYSAFTGGQDASTYQAVSNQDIQATANNLETVLTQSITSDYQRSMQAGYQLVTPITCNSLVTSDKPAGAKATQVRVTVKDTCQGVAYAAASIKSAAVSALAPSSEYTLQSSTIKLVVRASASLTILNVQASGELVYHWSSAQYQQFARLIAGKSEDQGTNLLLSQGSIVGVSIHVNGRDSGVFPSDPNRISFAIGNGSF